MFKKRTEDSGKTLPNTHELSLKTDTYSELVPLRELLNFKHFSQKSENDNYDVDILNTKLELKSESNYIYFNKYSPKMYLILFLFQENSIVTSSKV